MKELQFKRIRDPLYGFIKVPQEYLPILDHYIVQRLRWISQLPLEQLVYPSAQHSRFEHSLGTMHLARKAAHSLTHNSRKKFLALARIDGNFKAHSPAHKVSIFIESAGIAGLLHDVGHAPFSHTLEDACNHSQHAQYKYDHEHVGCRLAKKILRDANYPDEATRIVTRVLNKELDKQKLGPLEVLLRKIIDGPIDVDKGDYLRRDAYHCGVVYGVYDIDTLWDNVVITDNNLIGVNAKGAIEAWSLRLARYKMFHNSYKHHVRNITDALLIDIISRAFKITKNDENLRSSIMPFKTIEETQDNKAIHDFCSWTDNTLLKALCELDNTAISARIEDFTNRRLYKRCFKIDLAKEYPEYKSNMPKVYEALAKVQADNEKNDVLFNYILYPETIPPVFEEDVQKKILVVDGNKPIPLAAHLGFSDPRENSDPDQFSSYTKPYWLHVFTRNEDQGCKDDLYKTVADALTQFDIDIFLA